MNTTDFFKEFYATWSEHNTNMMKNFSNLTTESWKAESYEKFYRSWSEDTSAMMEKLMRMPGFANYSWEIFKNTTGFQEAFNQMTEAYLKGMNIPTHKDLSELHERLDYLDDKLEELESKMQSEKKNCHKRKKEEERIEQ
ncbi:MAG: hypothetical protein LWY06_06520 [Firmicutes bacterium]|nr:hypothetical protein [Bacillota bacterium]